jgi:hypothetical protein
MDLREIGWGGMDWIDLAQDRDQWWALVSMVMNLRVPSNVGKFFSSCATGGFSRRPQLHGVSWLVTSSFLGQKSPSLFQSNDLKPKDHVRQVKISTTHFLVEVRNKTSPPTLHKNLTAYQTVRTFTPFMESECSLS